MAEDAEPTERIDAKIFLTDCVRDRLPADTQEPVAACDVVAVDLLRLAELVDEANSRMLIGDVVHAGLAHPEANVGTGGKTFVDQILKDFVLWIDGYDAPAGQLLHIYVVATARETQFEALMDVAFTLESIPDARFDHKIDGALFQNSGTDRRFDRLT